MNVLKINWEREQIVEWPANDKIWAKLYPITDFNRVNYRYIALQMDASERLNVCSDVIHYYTYENVILILDNIEMTFLKFSAKLISITVTCNIKCRLWQGRVIITLLLYLFCKFSTYIYCCSLYLLNTIRCYTETVFQAPSMYVSVRYIII